MPVYMVDRSLPGISMDQLAAAWESTASVTFGRDIGVLIAATKHAAFRTSAIRPMG